eukprot:261930_1
MSILLYLFKIFLMNDFIIPWNLDYGITKQFKFVSMTDSLNTFCYAISKIAFYYSFTFHIQSLLNTKMSKFMVFWMVFVGICALILAILYAIDDAFIATKKEIGLTPNQFHIAMYSGHSGADIIPYISIVVIVIDMVYFCILLYRYISETKKMQSNNYNFEEGIKGIVLVLITCIVCWIVFILLGLDLEIRYALTNFDYISDDICLFLMFKSNQKLYDQLCGLW